MNKKYTKPTRIRNERLTIRLTTDEKNKFIEISKKTNLNYTDLLLTMIKRLEEENGLYNK